MTKNISHRLGILLMSIFQDMFPRNILRRNTYFNIATDIEAPVAWLTGDTAAAIGENDLTTTGWRSCRPET